MYDAVQALREAMIRIKELEERLKILEAKLGTAAQMANLITPGGSS